MSTTWCDAEEHRLERRGRKGVLLYEPVATKLILKRRLGSRYYLIRVKAHVDHEPGQFFQVTVLGFGEAPISIASYNKEHIDLVVSPVGSVTRELVRKKRGDRVLLRGPYGYGYPMDYYRGKNLALIGGGCGVAPLKGVMDYVALHRRHYRECACYFGYRNESDEIYAREMRAWERSGLFTFTYAYSNPVGKGACNAGYITDYLDGLSPSNSAALICGPPPMMLSTIKKLNELGFQDDQIWISHERHMKCATGMCGHCMIEGKYTCKDGPVFRWDWIKGAEG